MARRGQGRRRGTPAPSIPINPALVLIGDVRQAPVEIQEGGRVFKPDVVLWVRAQDGIVLGHLLSLPGQRSQLLVQALLEAALTPGNDTKPELPGRVILFDQKLADEVRVILSQFGVEVAVSAPIEEFDAIFADLFSYLEQENQEMPLELPDDVLRPLLAAADRLWRARPWEYVFDEPPFVIESSQVGVGPVYASVLGARAEVFGVSIFTTLDDFIRFVDMGENLLATPPGLEPDVPVDLNQVIQHPSFLLSFDPKESMRSDYRDHLARCGWSRRLSVVPTFAAVGGGREPHEVTAEDGQMLGVVVDALVTFCQRHRRLLATDTLPIEDSIDVRRDEQDLSVAVRIPPELDYVDEDEYEEEENGEGGADTAPAQTATVYRFKVSLSDDKDVWRRIDVRGDQTLVALHNAIQDAFDWDDDHMYSFFLSGKAWDRQSEFARPGVGGDMMEGHRSARVRLDRLGLRPRQRIMYIFDYGDEWRHDVRVEKMDLAPEAGRYPRIVEEHGTPPPQYPDWDDDEETDEDDTI
jgi:hypothetical protein